MDVTRPLSEDQMAIGAMKFSREQVRSFAKLFLEQNAKATKARGETLGHQEP